MGVKQYFLIPPYPHIVRSHFQCITRLYSLNHLMYRIGNNFFGTLNCFFRCVGQIRQFICGFGRWVFKTPLVGHSTSAPRIHRHDRQGSLAGCQAATAYIMHNSRQSRIGFVWHIDF